MSDEKPAGLVETVAKALAGKPLIDPENDNEWYMHEWFSEASIRDFAVAALDALGLREEDETDLNPHRTETTPWGPKFVRRTRYVTGWNDWEPIRD